MTASAIEKAAVMLRREAESMKECHTLGDDWCGDPAEADYREMIAVADAAIAERDELRAKIAETEKQEPVAFARWSANGLSEEPEKLVVTHEPPDSHSRRMASWFPLYALPGAQGE